MKKIVTGEEIGSWVASRIGRVIPWGVYQSIGIEKDGVIVGGTVIDEYVPGTRCSMHTAGEGKNWLNREYLFVVFDYAFRQLGCKVVILTVNSENTDSVKFTSHLGFKEECRIKGGSPEGDLLILSMDRDSCRWLNVSRVPR